MSEQNNFYWANLLHLGCNLWTEPDNSRGMAERSIPHAFTELQFDRALWDKHILELKEAGCNMLVMDVCEALRYESHPELAVKGSWTHDEMRKEVEKLRQMGFEVVPKLNFSSCHDIWLKDYSRMLSTPIYYQVCRDVIDEVCQVFHPQYFHLGMDEEAYDLQRHYDYVVIRQHDLWWKDFYYLVECVERHNARPWVWSDFMWDHPAEFLEKMPKDVIQSNWYYSGAFENLDAWHTTSLQSFDLLEKNGYDQIPAGSLWEDFANLQGLTRYCAEHISGGHHLGMMQTTWERIANPYMPLHSAAASTIARAKQWLEERT